MKHTTVMAQRNQGVDCEELVGGG